MSQTEAPTNPLFAGFQPQSIETPEAPAKPKRQRKAKEPKVEKAPKAAKEPKAAKPKRERKPRAAKALPAVLPPQYNLQTILKAMRDLHEEDYAVFDKLFAAPEASRKRIMASLAKIFP